VNQGPETTSPGIVVLSSSLQLLHMNRQAIALLAQWERTALSIRTKGAVPASLHQLCHEIMETLRARVRSNNWAQFYQYCAIGDSTCSILLKGFGLPDRRGLPHSRIVMLISPHTAASISGINGKEFSEGISGNSHLDADSPRAMGM